MLKGAEDATSRCATLPVDCFELKAIEIQQNQEKLFLNCLQEFIRGLSQEESYYQTGLLSESLACLANLTANRLLSSPGRHLLPSDPQLPLLRTAQEPQSLGHP